jgi:hypothetical protein
MGRPALAGPAAEVVAAKCPDPNSAQFPACVMRKIDDLYRGDQSHGLMEMNIKTTHWKRSLAMEFWAYGTEYSLIRILHPKKEKGSATLKAKNDLFTYLSKTSRTIKITAGMMGGSWMGSHFTNDDLIQESRRSEDYTIQKTYDGDESGTPIYQFTLFPKEDAAVVWGKIVITIRKADLQPLRESYYDEDGEKVRELEFSEHKDIGGRVMPTKMTMRPLDGSGEYTQVVWKHIDFSVKLGQGFFTLQKLKSM